MAAIDEFKDKPVEEIIKEFQTDLKKGLSEEEAKKKAKKIWTK